MNDHPLNNRQTALIAAIATLGSNAYMTSEIMIQMAKEYERYLNGE